jgi:hypothetical protein
MLSAMNMDFSIVGNQRILLKVLKATVHDERERSYWREQFNNYHRGSGR